MKKYKIWASGVISLVLCLLILLSFVGCDEKSGNPSTNLSLEITAGEGPITLNVGEAIDLNTNLDDEYGGFLEWTTNQNCVSVDSNGYVRAISNGVATVTVTYGQLSDSIRIAVIEMSDEGGDVTTNIPVDEEAKAEFYGDSDPADSYEEALARSELGILSGAVTVPDAEPTIEKNRPTKDGLLIRNSNDYFLDENTYVVVNSRGYEVFRVYRGGGYITLEEVAAYVYAFGDVPANYVSSKTAKPTSSIWGEYLRLNHSYFSGDTIKYPYEPELPHISGCGGYMDYYEIDIGTTGTDTGNGYAVRIYNNGTSIVRGAARIVYTHLDYDWDGVVEAHEKYVFYTYNHYNDFQEYLNYYGGWGEMFGNITGGGSISSRYDYNPTPYIPVTFYPLTVRAVTYEIYYYIPKESLLAA